MDDAHANLVTSWSITRPVVYLVLAVVGSMAVRLASCGLKGIDTYVENGVRKGGTFSRRFWIAFRGFGSQKPEDDDYWHPFILGVLELATLPILMALGMWTFVGAWVAFKGLGNFQYWQTRRSPFNRFLICNALMLSWAFILIAPLVAATRG